MFQKIVTHIYLPPPHWAKGQAQPGQSPGPNPPLEHLYLFLTKNYIISGTQRLIKKVKMSNYWREWGYHSTASSLNIMIG